MTQKRAAILLGNATAMATTPSWRHALQQHDLTAILLAPPKNAHGKTRAPYDLVLNVCDSDLATLRHTVTRLSNRFQIVAIVPPIGDSVETQQLGHSAAILAEELKLPGFTSAAFTLASNRYLTRCHWQQTQLPMSDFSLIQFPSALIPAAISIGLPVRLSPIHYQLRHLCAHIQREVDAPKAYQLIAHTLQRHILIHPAPLIENGQDPRTHHHIRFSWMSDMLASAEPTATSVETTVLVHDRVPQVVTCTPIAQRQRGTTSQLKRSDIIKMTELSIEGCKALQIQNGVATCLLQHAGKRILLDGIIPNHIDGRLIPAMEVICKQSWPEIMLKMSLQPA